MKQERPIFHGLVSNALFWLLVTLLGSSVVLGAVARWVHSLSDFERGSLLTLAFTLLVAALVLSGHRYLTTRKANRISDQAPAAQPPPQALLRPVLEVRQVFADNAAFLVVQNTGSPVDVECKIAAIYGVDKWPTRPVYAKWEGPVERKTVKWEDAADRTIRLGRGDVRRVVVAKCLGVMTQHGPAGRWTIYGEGDMQLHGGIFPIRREGLEEHELAPFELCLTVLSESPVPQIITRNFSFRGGVVDFTHGR